MRIIKTVVCPLPWRAGDRYHEAGHAVMVLQLGARGGWREVIDLLLANRGLPVVNWTSSGAKPQTRGLRATPLRRAPGDISIHADWFPLPGKPNRLELMSS